MENRVWFVSCFVFSLFGQNTNTANSINPEHMGPNRHQIIEYFGLSDSAYTDLGSYR